MAPANESPENGPDGQGLLVRNVARLQVSRPEKAPPHIQIVLTLFLVPDLDDRTTDSEFPVSRLALNLRNARHLRDGLNELLRDGDSSDAR